MGVIWGRKSLLGRWNSKSQGPEVRARPYPRQVKKTRGAVKARREGSESRACRHQRRNSTKGLRLQLGSKAGLEGEGVSEPNSDPLSPKISRTGLSWVNGGRRAYFRTRGEQRDIAKEPQVSLHTLHKAWFVLVMCTCFCGF